MLSTVLRTKLNAGLPSELIMRVCVVETALFLLETTLPKAYVTNNDVPNEKNLHNKTRKKSEPTLPRSQSLGHVYTILCLRISLTHAFASTSTGWGIFMAYIPEFKPIVNYISAFISARRSSPEIKCCGYRDA